MKLSDLRNTAGKLNSQDIPSSLAIVSLLPFLVCLIILISIPGIERKLLIHSMVTAVVLLAIGGATVAAFQYFEERDDSGRAAAMRSLVWAGGLIAPMIVTVLILSRLH